MFLYNTSTPVHCTSNGQENTMYEQNSYMRIIKTKILSRPVHDSFVNFHRADEMGKNDLLVKNLIHAFKKNIFVMY